MLPNVCNQKQDQSDCRQDQVVPFWICVKWTHCCMPEALLSRNIMCVRDIENPVAFNERDHNAVKQSVQLVS